MKTAGIREARQNLSALLEEVRRGHGVLITDRGRPVARLLPPEDLSAKPVSSRRKFRAGIRVKGEALSATVERERDDRL